MKTTLTLIGMYSILSVSVFSQIDQDSSSFCCRTQKGPPVQVSPTDLDEIVNQSPYYLIIGTPNSYNDDVDNICYTYFPIDRTTYVRFTALTHYNGSVLIQKYIAGSLTGYPGVTRIQGLAEQSGSSTIIFDEAHLGSPCPGVRVYYRRFIAGSCSVLQSENGDGSYFRHGDANTRSISDYCLSLVSTIANSQNFNGSDLKVYPYNLNSNCVTRWNGMSCVNAEKVRSQDSISIPDTGSSCQTLFY